MPLQHLPDTEYQALRSTKIPDARDARGGRCRGAKPDSWRGNLIRYVGEALSKKSSPPSLFATSLFIIQPRTTAVQPVKIALRVAAPQRAVQSQRQQQENRQCCGQGQRQGQANALIKLAQSGRLGVVHVGLKPDLGHGLRQIDSRLMRRRVLTASRAISAAHKAALLPPITKTSVFISALPLRHPNCQK